MELDIVEYDVDENLKKELYSTIKDLAEKTQAQLVLIVDDAGRTIAAHFQGDKTQEEKAEFISALISGVFGAACEMSKLLELEDLDLLEFEAKKMNVVIKSIKPRFLLCLMVSKDRSLGAVRLFLKEASQEIEELMQKVERTPRRVVKMDLQSLEEKLKKIIEL